METEDIENALSVFTNVQLVSQKCYATDVRKLDSSPLVGVIPTMTKACIRNSISFDVIARYAVNIET